MRCAIINDEVSQDLRVAAGLASDLGFGGLEIRSIDGVPPHRLTDAAVLEARKVLDEFGLEAAGFCPPALKHPIPTDAEGRAASRAVVERALAQARILRAGHVRIFSFYRAGDPEPEAAARVARQVLNGLTGPGDVRILLETGTRSNTPTLHHGVRFLEELDDPRIGLLWDPGNSVFSGFDAEPYPSDFLGAAGRIRHVHIKDPAGRTGYVRLGDGDLPWPAILRGLRDAGYAGWLSLETHWRKDRVLSGPERDEPWGAGISDGGVEASRECMRVLRQWCADV